MGYRLAMECNRLHQATVFDVARLSGVSVATVSRTFNFPDKVSPDTKRRVEKIAMSLGYVANSSARTLRTQKSRVLGVVLPTLLNPVFAECLEGIANAASQAGYAILHATTEYQLDAEERAVTMLLAGNVDGVILVVSNPSNSLALTRLQDSGVPYVLAYNRHEQHPCVSVDSETAVTELVKRLVRLGHQRIAMITGQLSASDRALQRCRGYQAGMKAEKLQPSLLEVPFINSATEEIQQFITQQDRPTALICSNDLLAIRSVRAAHQSGLSVPHDIAVVGFDGIALGKDLTPVLSTVVQPNLQIGTSAVELLVQSLISDQQLLPTASLTLPWTFREGESCTPVTPH
jgi:DNA-binding LacI/PurR family transcriptional regulator